MKFCTNCWNFDRCNAIGRVVDFSVDDGVCRDFDECKPQTNADRIRAMSDYELAKMLKDYKDCSKNCIISNGKHCYQICEEESVLLKWLQQPAEGE